MNHSKSLKHWWLLIVRGLSYLALGVTLFFFINSPARLPAQMTGILMIVAGICGCIYAIYTLRDDRNYFWELLRSFFDLGFGIAFLIYSKSKGSGFPEAFGFWAILNASLQTVQAIYVSMLTGVKQPRNVFGTQVHHVGVLVAIALAYLVLSPPANEISWGLVGSAMLILGLIILISAIQQRRTFLRD